MSLKSLPFSNILAQGRPETKVMLLYSVAFNVLVFFLLHLLFHCFLNLFKVKHSYDLWKGLPWLNYVISEKICYLFVLQMASATSFNVLSFLY